MPPAKNVRVQLFPRRKAGDQVYPEKGRQPVKVDLETISSMFGMPQPEAARVLDLSLTALKQVCRKLGITRWPYKRPCKRGKRSRSNETTALRSSTINAGVAPSSTTPSSTKSIEAVVAAPAIVVTEEDCASDSYSVADTTRYFDSEEEWEAITCPSAQSSREHQDEEEHNVMQDLQDPSHASHLLDAAHEHDLGWLVSESDEQDATSEEWMVEMALRERFAEIRRIKGQENSTAASAPYSFGPAAHDAFNRHGVRCW